MNRDFISHCFPVGPDVNKQQLKRGLVCAQLSKVWSLGEGAGTAASGGRMVRVFAHHPCRGGKGGGNASPQLACLSPSLQLNFPLPTVLDCPGQLDTSSIII